MIDLNIGSLMPKNETIQTIKSAVCEIQPAAYFWWWLLPIMIFLLILLIVRFRDFWLNKIFKIAARRGYIKIVLRLENKHLKEFLVKPDNLGNFRFKGRRYTLENLQDFIIGYDKRNFPVFYYDYQFILPLELTKVKIDKAITNLLTEADPDIKPNEIQEKISQFSMAINPAILDLVYSRKLISDLYASFGDEQTKKIIIFVIIGVVILVILYYTGLLAMLLAFLGINMPAAGTTG